MKKNRTERDCLGTMEIPDDRYYGIQTSRMVKVSGCAHLPVIFYPGMPVRSFASRRPARSPTPKSVP